jgi:hypothetical protein
LSLFDIKPGDLSMVLRIKIGFLLSGINHVNHKISNKIDKIILDFDNSYSVLALSNEDKSLLKKNAVFYNCHKGQRCFIIGNGPSLKSQDLTNLAGENTFVMNGFWKHPIVDSWQPKYYFLADPLFFDGSDPMKFFFAGLDNKIKKTEIFIPLSAKKIVERDSLLSQEHTNYIAFNGLLAEGNIKKIDFTQTVPGVQSVSQFAIMAAMYMGCSPIYLMGLDHDWLAHRGQDQHFYPDKTIENHPTADGDLNKIPYKSDLESVLNLWKGYETIKMIAEKQHTQIYNATNGGFLDVFPRKQYETLFNQ